MQFFVKFGSRWPNAMFFTFEQYSDCIERHAQITLTSCKQIKKALHSLYILLIRISSNDNPLNETPVVQVYNII